MKNKKLNGLAYVLVTGLFVSGLTVSAFENNSNEEITKDKALEIVLEETNVNKNEVSKVEVEYDKEDKKYEVDFNVGKTEYDYEISINGKVLKSEKEKKEEKQESVITKEKALVIALNHAKLTADQISKLEIEYDKEDKKYEVEFNVGTTEYDYEISTTGKVLKSEKEVEEVKEVTIITKEEVKAIVLKHAEVSASEISRYEIEFDDNKYEVSFNVGNVEYDYEIGVDGKILDFEKEIDD